MTVTISVQETNLPSITVDTTGIKAGEDLGSVDIHLSQR